MKLFLNYSNENDFRIRYIEITYNAAIIQNSKFVVDKCKVSNSKIIKFV